jgi:mannose-6-phosphate isomerase-like protein (cupin superfamily)
MEMLHTDAVIRVPPGTTPNYDQDNSLLALMTLIEGQQLAAERDYYVARRLQYLFPIADLALYGPSGGAADTLDPKFQDSKTDFQKQNVKAFTTTHTSIVRGLVRAGAWSGPFVRLSYDGGPDTPLARATRGKLGNSIRLYLKVGGVASPSLLTAPYVEASDRYEIELWGYSAPGDLAASLGEMGAAALARGELVARPDLVQGSAGDFAREALEGRSVFDVAPGHALHPIRPLHIELAWANAEATVWDSMGGANYHYEFSMVLRGWENFLSVGTSPNPHGGVGLLEYRNLMSNYGQFVGTRELGRTIPSWSFDAFQKKADGERREEFFAVDYMDLHIVKPNCGIGLHRHRDNQEAFLMMEGRALMVVGDWCKMPNRERCIEVRTLEAGHMALLKGGNLHGLMNPTDENLFLFMFGGYD